MVWAAPVVGHALLFFPALEVPMHITDTNKQAGVLALLLY